VIRRPSATGHSHPNGASGAVDKVIGGTELVMREPLKWYNANPTENAPWIKALDWLPGRRIREYSAIQMGAGVAV
jgi:hypothetical protein